MVPSRLSHWGVTIFPAGYTPGYRTRYLWLPLALRLASAAILLLVKCPRWAKSLVESRLPSSRSIRTICKRMIARTSDFYMMLKVSGKELGSYFVMAHFIEMTRAIDYAL